LLVRFPEAALRTRERVRGEFPRLLARQLVGLAHEKERVRLEHDEPDWIPRPVVADAFHWALASDKSIIVLYGDAGTGKSTAAEHLAELYAVTQSDELPPVVMCQSEDSLRDTVIEVLALRIGGNFGNASLGEVSSQFRKLLASDKAPSVVVLDNVDNRAQLDQLVPKAPWSKIIITSRKRLDDNDPRIAYVEVVNMELDEARQLVARHAPDLQGLDVDLVAARLDCRPLAIVHGCACLSYGSYDSVAEFLAALERSTAQVLDGYGDDENVTLTAIYRLIVEQLSSYPEALRLVDILLYVGNGMSTEDVLLLSWTAPDSVSGPSGAKRLGLRAVDHGSFLKALCIARRWSLIRQVDYNRRLAEKRSNSKYWQMHELTCNVLTSLRRDVVDQVTDRAFQNIYERLNLDTWEGGHPLPFEWPRLYRVLMAIAAFVRPGEFGGFVTPERADRLNALTVRECRETGYLSKTWGLVRAITWSSVEVAPFTNEVRAASEPMKHLDREALELRFLSYETEAGYDDRLLAAVRRRTPDHHIYEAVLASEFRPFFEDCDTNALIAFSSSVLAEQPSPSTVWIRARHAYALAVLFHQLGELEKADILYSHSRGTYWTLAKSEPEYEMYAAECTRRIVELAMRQGNLEKAEDQLRYTIPYWSKVHKIAKTEPGDSLLYYRHAQTSSKYWLERHLRGMGDEGRFPLARLDIMRKIEAFYARARLDIPAFEARFDLCRALVVDDPAAAQGAMRLLSESCSRRNYTTGYLIASLTEAKLAFIDPNTHQSWYGRNARIALEVASRMQGRSLYWYADALCLSLAAAVRASMGQESIEATRSLAVEATFAIQRPDKVAVAEDVSQGRMSPLHLLAE
jgi:hypothetical protein